MKWVSIKNRLPEIDKSVLVLTDSGIIEGSLDCNGNWSTITLDRHGCGCCGYDTDEFTHWMNLPEKPKV